MVRISLKEQYDNKDVVTQIYALKDTVANVVDIVADVTDIATSAESTANAAAAAVTGYDADISALKSSDTEQNTEIAALETTTASNTSDISQLKISDAENTEAIATNASAIDNHARQITALQATTAQHTSDIQAAQTEIAALTKELPTELVLHRTGEGKIQLQYAREDMTDLDSNVLDMIIPYQYDIVPGTTSRSFKLAVTFSDGTTAQTNDFVIPEGGGTSVSVVGVRLVKSTDANKFKVQLLLDDTTTIDSGEMAMVSSVSGAFANNRLTVTVNGVTSTPISIDTGANYTAGTGVLISGGEISVDTATVALKTDISDMETKTNAANTYLTKTSASSTYLTKTNASNTYATKTAISDMETKTNAANTYLTKTSASSTYLTKTNASNTYLTKTNASNTYATKSSVTTLTSSVQDCFNDVSYDSSTNALTLTALDGQSNTVNVGVKWSKGRKMTVLDREHMPLVTFITPTGYPYWGMGWVENNVGYKIVDNSCCLVQFGSTSIGSVIYEHATGHYDVGTILYRADYTGFYIRVTDKNGTIHTLYNVSFSNGVYSQGTKVEAEYSANDCLYTLNL